MYTAREMEYLTFLRKSLVEKHKQCGGTGFYKGEDCICLKVFRWLKCLYVSRIPKEYWSLNYDLSLKNTVTEYFNDFEENYMNGKSWFMYGDFGTGKTTTLCEMGKRFLFSGKRVIYFLLKEYIDSVFETDTILRFKINEADVILIDEADKVYVKKGSDYVLREVEVFLRNKLMNNYPVFFASNVKRSLMKNIYGGDSLQAILERKTDEINVKDKVDFKNRDKIKDFMNSKNVIQFALKYDSFYKDQFEG
jgi:DNA replication protein DnaC